MKRILFLICTMLYAHALFAQDTIDISNPSQCSPGAMQYQYAVFDSSDYWRYCDNPYGLSTLHFWPWRYRRDPWTSFAIKHHGHQMPPIYGIGIPIWYTTDKLPPELMWGFQAGNMKLRPIIVIKSNDSIYPAIYGREITSDQFYTRPADAYVKAPYYPDCDSSNKQWTVSKVLYLYFDSAVTMTDTFYFGVATGGWPEAFFALSFLNLNCQGYPTRLLNYPLILFKQIDSNDFEHVHLQSANGANVPFILLFNPPDTDSYSCPEVEDFTYLGIQADYPTFMWTAPDSVHQYEVCYGPYDADPDTLPTVTVDSSNIFVLTDRTLSPDIYYQARCRAVCRHVCPIHDTTLLAPWSAPQYFYTGSSMPDTTHRDTSHVALPQPLSPLPFTLSPNPAHGSVSLLLPENALPATLVMHDAAGREVLRRRITAPQTTLSTRTLPAGLYHVTLSTSTSTATQKLTVR